LQDMAIEVRFLSGESTKPLPARFNPLSAKSN